MLVDLLQVIGFIVDLLGLPQLPDDAEPAIGQTAVGMTLGHTASQALAEVGHRPLCLKGRRLGELLSSVAMVTVTSLAEVDTSSLSALVGDGTGTGQRLNRLGRGKTITMVTKHHQELGSEQVAGTG